MRKADPPVIVEQNFDTDITTVWEAITQVSQMRQWFFDNIPEFNAEVGFETDFEVDTGERVFPHHWKIIEVIPRKKIIYHWSYGGYDGEGLVIFELTEEKSYTKLVLTNLVIEDFSDEVPEFQRESCIGGWEYFINQRLVEYLKSITT